jgi:valyl-tRNA synthetase
MLGDTAVAVHPDDERYRALVGADVELPLTGRTIPVIADAWVDPEFGTGMVKVTPAHDPNDFEMAGRAGIPLLDIMNDDASLNENAPEAFRGLDRFEAREAVLAALAEEGLLAGDDPHTHSLPRCYRCDTVVEPRLSLQWFVRMEPLARPALAASRDGTITFTPERWKKVYEHWLENIRDWCISRQLWWGHRIPVWYCDACDATHVLRTDPEVWRRRAAAGSRRAGHLVQLVAVAHESLRLARRHARPRGVLSGPHPGDGARDPVLLGDAHDHGGLRVHG